MIEENEAQHRQLVRKQAEIDELRRRVKELDIELSETEGRYQSLVDGFKRLVESEGIMASDSHCRLKD